ncbi:MAG TPA: anthranilate phosphoribosyltransferase, partial [Myxococcota bacterium]|nr:anthranilate phosphoribosyltransferase [Myxococcota bacterium]
MLTPLLKRLMRGEPLSEAEMSAAVGHIMDGAATPAQIAAFLVALRIKGESIDEITGAARAMRQRMTRIEAGRRPLMDTCGTGGDGAGTFNISTAVSFVVAACGVAVAKHGNRAVSSKSGAADVLAALGVNIEAPKAVVEACIEDFGLGFLFAPALHPAMRHAGVVRRELGVRTVFNVVGPLTNPAMAPRQLMGVFDRKLTRVLAEVLGKLGSERAWVVHGADGLDELTLCDISYVAEWTGAEVVERTLSPEEVGLTRVPPEALAGGDAQENARTMRGLLAGKGPPPLADAVALNTGAALLIAGVAPTLDAGVRR